MCISIIAAFCHISQSCCLLASLRFCSCPKHIHPLSKATSIKQLVKNSDFETPEFLTREHIHPLSKVTSKRLSRWILQSWGLCWRKPFAVRNYWPTVSNWLIATGYRKGWLVVWDTASDMIICLVGEATFWNMACSNGHWPLRGGGTLGQHWLLRQFSLNHPVEHIQKPKLPKLYVMVETSTSYFIIHYQFVK